MKANAFEKLIRKVVREEIDYALRREIKSLREDLRDEFKTPIIEQSKPTPKTTQKIHNSLKEQIMGKKINKQNFVSNNTLNNLLNETAMGDTNTESTMMVSENQMPKEVANVVNRDYRELMKAMDKRKNSRP
jgi:hypothetical protein